MKWQYEHKVMGRNNVYTYWVEKRQPPAPVRYEMVGYDTLLISYYDKYIIKYQTFEKWEYDKAIFKIPQGEPGMMSMHTICAGGEADCAVMNIFPRVFFCCTLFTS